jgi:L-fuconolactonase
MGSIVVDSHCHVSADWYEPVESLVDQMNRVGVSQAVLIQMIAQTDNGYQQECLKRYPGHFASVVWVDPASPSALSDLRKLAKEGATGVRLRPLARSPGADPLAIWRCAEECDLAVSCVGNSTAFLDPEFAHRVGECPALMIVLEHLGNTSQPATDDAAKSQHARVMELARFPNVYLKVPGLGELATRKSPLPAEGGAFDPEAPAVLHRAIESFGAPRLMWGSDFPPVSSREGYGNSLALLRRILQFLRPAELDDIFGGVARRVFRLPTLDTADGRIAHRGLP